jgi:hypothetical protein
MYQPILNEKNVTTDFIQICAWCDADNKNTNEYRAYGFKASHGICKGHFEEVLKETKEIYEKNGFIVDDDGLRINPSASVQNGREFSI